MVHDLACDLEKISDMMDTTLTTQTEQLGRIADKTQHASHRIQSQNAQVKKINQDLDS